MMKKVLIILIPFFFIGCSLTNDDTYTIKNDEVDVYSKTKVSDIISINNGEIIDDYYIDTDNLGKKNLSIEYEHNKEKKRINITVNIVDKEPPYISKFSSYSHLIGTNFTIHNDVFSGDNYSKELTKEVIGDYDLNTLGSYEVIYKVTDSSGNSTENPFILKVIEASSNTNSNKSVLSLDDIEVPNGAYLMVDVSKWDEDIDWNKVYSAGVHYAMIRLGTQKCVECDSVVDPYYLKNIKEAKKAGLEVGVYYYSYAKNVKEAKEQAKWVIDTLDGEKLDLPVAFDWECFKYFNSYDINFHDLNNIAISFLEEIENSGYKSIIYGSKNYLENVWNTDKYPTWLAHYTSKTDYKGKYLMWQFTENGVVPGINHNCDINFYYKENDK